MFREEHGLDSRSFEKLPKRYGTVEFQSVSLHDGNQTDAAFIFVWSDFVEWLPAEGHVRSERFNEKVLLLFDENNKRMRKQTP